MTKKSLYLLYGPPASGKTILADFISKKSGSKYISLGSAIRREISLSTQLGIELKSFLDRVIEYPPILVTEIIRKEVQENEDRFDNFIIDGFPKYNSEIPAFFKFIEEKGFELKNIFILEAPLDVILQRARLRRICSSCLLQQTFIGHAICKKCGGPLITRDDDVIVVLKRRYRDFINSIDQLSESLFSKAQSVIYINGNQSVSEMRKELIAKMPE